MNGLYVPAAINIRQPTSSVHMQAGSSHRSAAILLGQRSASVGARAQGTLAATPAASATANHELTRYAGKGAALPEPPTIAARYRPACETDPARKNTQLTTT